MARLRIRIRLAYLLLLVALVARPSPSVAQSEVTTYTPLRIAWTELGYQGGKMGVKAESQVKIELVPTTEVSSDFVDAGERGAIQPSGDQIARLFIETSVKGTHSVSELLLNPENAAAYQRAQVSTSKKKNYRRVYRYLTDGVFVQRQIPDVATGDPLDWPISNSRVIEFPAGVAGQGVTEGMALFYMLSAADFREVGDKLRFLNFDRDGMTEVVMTVENLQQMKVDYQEISPTGQRRVKETRTVALLTVSGSAIGEGEDAFEFLGLRGKIEIFADTELRIPVAVKGRVPVAGKTTVHVNRVVIK